MPRVPISDNVVSMVRGQPQAPPPSQTMLAMAAAVMHEQGRLLDPTPMSPPQSFQKTPNQRVQEGHEDVTPAYTKVWEGGDESRLMNKRGDILQGKTT